jgi:ribonuclease E
VQLRSGGYLVINQAEALVAIDVNSGRSTRERNVEETALRTNLEAADEVARQLRLRDLAGLIVIDFIDMESKRHNAMVERRIKEALKNDRARIQVGHISHFGLLEMSRQRLRPSLAETSFVPCPHCGGTGHVRSTENAAIHVLRGIEDEGSKRRAAEIIVYVSTPVALYILNHKRDRLREIELRYAMRVVVAADDAQIAPQFRIEKIRTRSPDEAPVVITAERSMLPEPAEDEDEDDDDEAEAEAVGAEGEEEDIEEDTSEQSPADAAGTGDPDEAERRRRRRRRRRRGGRRDEPQTGAASEPEGEQAQEEAEPPAERMVVAEQAHNIGAEPIETGDAAGANAASPEAASPEAASPEAAGPDAANPDAASADAAGPDATGSDEDTRNRRRGRRGGRRRRRDGDADLSPFAVPGADQPELQPVYAGPTPADPFGGGAFDIFDVMDQAERAAEARPAPRVAPTAEIVNSGAPEPEATPASDPEPVSASTQDAAPPEAEPGAPAEAEPEVMPETSAAAMPDPEILNSTAPEPATEALHARAEAKTLTPANDTGAEIAHPEPARPEPLVKPILIGADSEPPVERKRGWWRR